MTYRAVFFDAGETLLAPHPSFPELFARVLEGQGHPVGVAEAEAVLQDVLPAFIDRTGDVDWTVSREASRRFWGSLYASMFERLGIADPESRLFEALYGRFTRHDSYRLFPDVLPTIRALRDAGLVLGVISNWEEWLESLLDTMDVAPLFDVIVVSGRVGIQKPDPSIFRMGLEQAGTQPDESVYVGDHPRIDVEGAAAAGMSGVLIDRRGRYPDFPGPRIRRLDELLSVIGARRAPDARQG